MGITTATNPGSQQHFERDRDGKNVLFPQRAHTGQSHIVDIGAQPVTFMASGFPAGVIAKFQVAADRQTWSDWKIHGKQVLLSAEHTVQWVNFTGQYRLVLVDSAGAAYTNITQPNISWYPATTTHERPWSLVDSSIPGPQGPIGLAGPAGVAGAVGPAGVAGAVGPAGVAGAVGPAGVAGAVGPAGVAGAVGPQGPPGSYTSAFVPGPAAPLPGLTAGVVVTNGNGELFLAAGGGTFALVGNGYYWSQTGWAASGADYAVLPPPGPAVAPASTLRTHTAPRTGTVVLEGIFGMVLGVGTLTPEITVFRAGIPYPIHRLVSGEIPTAADTRQSITGTVDVQVGDVVEWRIFAQSALAQGRCEHSTLRYVR
jgi:hypothetical protein